MLALASPAYSCSIVDDFTAAFAGFFVRHFGCVFSHL